MALFSKFLCQKIWCLKHVDSLNNKRKYKKGKVFSEVKSKIKRVYVPLNWTLKNLNVHWLGPKYPILKLFFKMDWFNSKSNGLWKFWKRTSYFQQCITCKIKHSCMSKFQVLAFKGPQFAQSFFIVRKKLNWNWLIIIL